MSKICIKQRDGQELCYCPAPKKTPATKRVRHKHGHKPPVSPEWQRLVAQTKTASSDPVEFTNALVAAAKGRPGKPIRLVITYNTLGAATPQLALAYLTHIITLIETASGVPPELAIIREQSHNLPFTNMDSEGKAMLLEYIMNEVPEDKTELHYERQLQAQLRHKKKRRQTILIAFGKPDLAQKIGRLHKIPSLNIVSHAQDWDLLGSNLISFTADSKRPWHLVNTTLRHLLENYVAVRGDTGKKQLQHWATKQDKERSRIFRWAALPLLNPGTTPPAITAGDEDLDDLMRLHVDATQYKGYSMASLILAGQKPDSLWQDPACTASTRLDCRINLKSALFYLDPIRELRSQKAQVAYILAAIRADVSRNSYSAAFLRTRENHSVASVEHILRHGGFAPEILIDTLITSENTCFFLSSIRNISNDKGWTWTPASASIYLPCEFRTESRGLERLLPPAGDPAIEHRIITRILNLISKDPGGAMAWLGVFSYLDTVRNSSEIASALTSRIANTVPNSNNPNEHMALELMEEHKLLTLKVRQDILIAYLKAHPADHPLVWWAWKIDKMDFLKMHRIAGNLPDKLDKWPREKWWWMIPVARDMRAPDLSSSVNMLDLMELRLNGRITDRMFEKEYRAALHIMVLKEIEINPNMTQTYKFLDIIWQLYKHREQLGTFPLPKFVEDSFGHNGVSELWKYCFFRLRNTMNPDDPAVLDFLLQIQKMTQSDDLKMFSRHLQLEFLPKLSAKTFIRHYYTLRGMMIDDWDKARKTTDMMGMTEEGFFYSYPKDFARMTRNIVSDVETRQTSLSMTPDGDIIAMATRRMQAYVFYQSRAMAANYKIAEKVQRFNKTVFPILAEVAIKILEVRKVLNVQDAKDFWPENQSPKDHEWRALYILQGILKHHTLSDLDTLIADDKSLSVTENGRRLTLTERLNRLRNSKDSHKDSVLKHVKDLPK